MIAEQIERAAVLQEEAQGDSTGSSPPPPTELIRNEGERVKLSFSLKKPSVSVPDTTNNPATSSGAPVATAQTVTSELASKPGASTSSSVEGPSTHLPPVAFKASGPTPTNVFKTNVFKTAAKPAVSNVFKSSSSTAKPILAGSATSAGTKRPLSMTEALMQEDMERKRRRMDREAARV
jgi:hypothetical protein